jgi:hypothetical protein
MTSARQFMSSKRWFNHPPQALQNLETYVEDVDALYPRFWAVREEIGVASNSAQRVR